MSSKGYEQHIAQTERENRRRLRFLPLVRLFFIACIAAMITTFLPGCVREPQQPAQIVQTRTITKTVTQRIEVKTPVCPTDSQLREVAIAASRATYQQAPGGERGCACPTDTYQNRGATLSCSGPGAIKSSSWTMCTQEQVPQSLVDQMRAKIEACAQA